ncbi:hypothetical protein ACOSQ2_002582 [Xanthoceras sorbifolium]
MKFFFSDMGSCYRPATPRVEKPAVGGGGNQLQPGPCSSKRKKHSHWRPGLSAIAEDGGVVSAKEIEKKVESGKKSPSKSGSSTAKDHRHSPRYNNDAVADAYDHYYSRKKSIPLFIPAFSPTPYPF